MIDVIDRDSHQKALNGDRKVFIIKQGICTLNEYTYATRANKQASARLKKNQEEIIGWYIRQQLKGWSTEKPIYVIFTWCQKNRKKDKDNIAFAKKFIFDALVKTHTIKDDSWKNVVGFRDEFIIDPKNGDYVVVEIYEAD